MNRFSLSRAVLVAYGIYLLLPLYWLLSMSLRSNAEIVGTFSLFPTTATFANFAEIFSNHGRGEFYGNEPHYSHHPGPTLEGQSWQDQLATARQLGCIAASDDHWARPGNCGLAAVWAQQLIL